MYAVMQGGDQTHEWLCRADGHAVLGNVNLTPVTGALNGAGIQPGGLVSLAL